MRTRRTTTIEKLRLAVDCLPRSTRLAMLAGLRATPIIVGAYSTREGICPMLAAHRGGGRTSCISFAKAWDRFTLEGARTAEPRRATERELRVLTAHLEMSLLADERASGGLAGAIAEHEAVVARRPRPQTPARPQRQERHERHRPGDRDRSREMRTRAGWSWTRVVRRYDDFQDTLRQAQTSTPSEHAPV